MRFLFKGLLLGLMLVIPISGRCQQPQFFSVYIARDTLGLSSAVEKKGEISLESYEATYREMIRTVGIEARKVGGNLIVPIEGRRYTFPSKRRPNSVRVIVYQVNEKDVDYRYMWRTLAQEHPMKYDGARFEINVGIGSSPYYAFMERPAQRKPDWYSGKSPRSLSELYHDCYDVHISPGWSLECSYYLCGAWSLVGSAGFSQVRASYFDPYSDLLKNSETEYCFDILAGLRLNYHHTKKCHIYSQAKLGALFHTGGEFLSNNENIKMLGWQITGIGISVGSTLYGVAEVGFGTEFFGVRMGVGIKM